MWKIYATESPTNFSAPTTTLHVLDFKESSYISRALFRNRTKTHLYLNANDDPIIDGGRMSSYVQNIASGNLLDYNRLNILKRYLVPDTEEIKYMYDGYAYTWMFNPDAEDHSVYRLQFLKDSEVMYTYYPENIFNPVEPGVYLKIPKDCILGCYLVGCPYGSNDKELGVVRLLWHADFSGMREAVSGIAQEELKNQWWLGPALTDGYIYNWVDNLEEENENEPLEPTTDPTGALTNESPVTAGFNWGNEFKATEWTKDTDGNALPWPDRYIVDDSYQHGLALFKEYEVFNIDNDPHSVYHLNDSSARNLTGLRTLQKKYNDHKAAQGTGLWFYDYVDSTHGYFTTYNNDIDQLSNPDYRQYYGIPTHIIQLNGIATNGNRVWLKIDWSRQAYNNLGRIEFEASNGSKFCIERNYNKVIPASIDLSDSRGFCLSPMIVKHAGRWFLGSIFTYGNSASFCIICQIDNLEQLSNYGGSDPGDPIDLRNDPNYSDYANGISTYILNAVFSKTILRSNPTSDSLTNDAIGDAPADENDGSPYNPDGTPRDPADNKNDPGTGEKNTNPVDSTKIPNIHDGSMGNGTGDPHDGDTKLPDPSDDIPDETGDEGTVTGTGILSVFTPTLAELNTFTSELLSTTVLNSIKNYFTTNPMDGIFGLHILPYTGFAAATTANPRIGNHNFTASLTEAATEFITVDYGTKDVPFVYDGYENYAPYSDAKLYLPFLGTKDIDINIIQGCSCSLKYNVSLVTGDIYAYLYARWNSKWGDHGTLRGVDHLVYSWQGNCASTIPLSHLDSTNYISGAMQAAGGITSLVAGAATGNITAIPAGLAGVTNGVAQIGRSSIITSGNLSGMAAYMSEKTPYFIFSRPIIAFNKTYNHYVGQRANAICMIANLTPGKYTQMSNVDLQGIPATSSELEEIASVLKGGFYT